MASLVSRHLRRPVLAMIDGNPGLALALASLWPGLALLRLQIPVDAARPCLRMTRGKVHCPLRAAH